jgi:hypothetical protein
MAKYHSVSFSYADYDTKYKFNSEKIQCLITVHKAEHMYEYIYNAAVHRMNNYLLLWYVEDNIKNVVA